MRPYIMCHMVMSMNGLVTGDFLWTKESEIASSIYFSLHREYRKNGFDGFVCGRTTMEESFTKGSPWNLESTPNLEALEENQKPFYAVAFDPKGKLGWEKNFISDEDPGYDKCRILEVLSEQVNKQYMEYLKKHQIPFIVSGKDFINVENSLEQMYEQFGIRKLLLEGGSVVNGHFFKANVVDEISLVIVPQVAFGGKPLFAEGTLANFELVKLKQESDCIVCQYRKRV